MELIKTKQELKNIIENNGREELAVIKFSASWCGPCRQMEKSIENIEKENSNVKFYNIDVDESPDLAEEYDVMSIPVLLYYKGSLQVDRTTGGIPEVQLRKKIAENNEK